MTIVKIKFPHMLGEPVPPPVPPPVDQRKPYEIGHADKAATELGQGFSWSQSAEGYEFWKSVYLRLKQIETTGELK